MFLGGMTMKQNLINDVLQAMIPYLNNSQAEKLQSVLLHELWNYEVLECGNRRRKAKLC